MTEFTKVFPPLQSSTYLNTPALGLISHSVNEFRETLNTGLYRKASIFHGQKSELIPEIREKIASFFNGEAARVALLPSFSIGLNAILEGLDPKSSILLIDEDYPSINRAVEARSFQTSYIESSANLESLIYDRFQKGAPDVFVFSIVQYLNGLKIDLDFLKTLKREFPKTLLIADGTQYLGTEPFDFQSSGVDILGASAYKWLNAGHGNAFFMFKPEMDTRITPKFIGFGSDLGPYKSRGNTLIGKFEGNHLDLAAIGSLKIALDVQEQIGIEFIADRIDSLSQKAKSVFEDLNLLGTSVVDRKQHSSIFNLAGDGNIMKKLSAQNIVASQRGGGIRVGFHYYNTAKDLDKLIDAFHR